MGHLTKFKVSACMRRPKILPNAAANAKISQQDLDDFFDKFRSAILCNTWILRVLLFQFLISTAGMIAGIALAATKTITIGFFFAFLGYKLLIILFMGCNRRSRQEKIDLFLDTENNTWRQRGATWTSDRVGCFGLYMFLDSSNSSQP